MKKIVGCGTRNGLVLRTGKHKVRLRLCNKQCPPKTSRAFMAHTQGLGIVHIPAENPRWNVGLQQVRWDSSLGFANCGMWSYFQGVFG